MRAGRGGLMGVLVLFIIFVTVVLAGVPHGSSTVSSLRELYSARVGGGLGLPSIIPACDLTEEDVREMLVDFYHSTGGPWWYSTQQGQPFLTNGSVCSWFGVSCSLPGTRLYGLEMPSNNLTGQLPASWSHFCNLQSLSLPHNNLYGPLPAFINATQLGAIQLYQNNFNGSLPDTWCDLVALASIKLANNRLSGAIPGCLISLPGLWIVDLSNNFFEGELPIIRSDNIAELNLAGNRLSGELPKEWEITSFWSLTITDINLSHNQFVGPIPASLLNNTSIRSLVLSHNQLNGTIPSGPAWHTMQVVLLNDNDLEGELPSPHFRQTTALTVLDVSDNLLNGTVSDNFIQAAPSLVFLSIKGNTNMSAFAGKGKIHWLSLDYGDLGSNDRRSYYCPNPVTQPPYSFTVMASPEFFGYERCRCAPGYVGAPPHDCHPCPIHCNCTEGGTVVSWHRGFYPVWSDDYLIAALPCADQENESLNKSMCNPTDNCYTPWNQPQLNIDCILCSPGTDGRLCSKCLCPAPSNASFSCYFASHRQCVPCDPELTALYTTIIALVAASFCALIVASTCIWRRYPFSRALRRATNQLGDRGTIKIALIFAQTTAAVNGAWPEWIQSSGMRLLGLTNASVIGVGAECLAPWMSDPVLNLGAHMSLVPIITTVIIVGVCIHSLWRKIRGKPVATPMAEMHYEEPQETATFSASAGIRESRQLSEQLSAEIIAPRALQLEEDYTDGGDDDDQSVIVREDTVDNFVLIMPLRPVEKNPRLLTIRYRRSLPWEMGLRAWIWTIYALLFGITLRVSDVFNCTSELNGVTYMSTVPWLRCDENGEWGTMRILAFISLSVFVIGIPVVFTVLLYAYRPRFRRQGDLETEEARQTRAAAIGPLFACYRPSMYWFELVVTARRILLAVLVGFVPESNLARGGSIALVLVGSLLVQHRLAPYRRELDNRLEEAALGTAAFTFALQSAWRSLNVLNSITSEQLTIPDNDYADFLITADRYMFELMAVLVTLNVAVLVILTGFVLWPFASPLWWKLMRRWRTKPTPTQESGSE